jgi:hypothetical protein
MSEKHFSATHHTDKTGKLIAWIIAVVVFIAAAIGLSWNESKKVEKKIAQSEAVVDSLSQEIEWRQKIIVRHDSLEKVVADAKTFRKLPLTTRQEIRAEMDKTTPKLASTKKNIDVFKKLLAMEQDNLAALNDNALYKLYH